MYKTEYEEGIKMKLEEYKSGNYIKVGDYSAFNPSDINHDWIWENGYLNNLLSEANFQIGSLDGYAQLIPNLDLYIKMHVRVEANKSNRIEGTQTTLDEDLSDGSDISPEKHDDWQEVQNYIEALNYGVNRIKTLPLGTRLIKEIHAKLLQGVRSEHKSPGEYRRSQNWIGGSRPSNAIYVPPTPESLNNHLSDLEKFINNDKISTPSLVKAAIFHYQFESIHPFLDGNGRVGRILIPLYLLESDLLHEPCFYISDYIERHKSEYYDALSYVREHDNMIGWIEYFLYATIDTAKTARNKFKKVVDLTREIDQDIFNMPIRADNARKIFDAFFNSPIMSRNELSKQTGIPLTTINDTIHTLVSEGIIVEKTGAKRNQLFAFEKYISLFRD